MVIQNKVELCYWGAKYHINVQYHHDGVWNKMSKRISGDFVNMWGPAFTEASRVADTYNCFVSFHSGILYKLNRDGNEKMRRDAGMVVDHDGVTWVSSDLESFATKLPKHEEGVRFMRVYNFPHRNGWRWSVCEVSFSHIRDFKVLYNPNNNIDTFWDCIVDATSWRKKNSQHFKEGE